MKRCFIILLILIQFSCFNTADAQWNSPSRYNTLVFSPAQIVTLNNVAYSKAVDVLGQTQIQYLNIYAPNKICDGVEKRPLIVIVHGGAFKGNYRTKEAYAPYATILAQMGYVVACIDYRLYNNCQYNKVNSKYTRDGQLSDLPWYVAVQDLNAAIKFICGQTNAYVDNENIFLFGESAGAITTLILALADQSEIYQELFSPDTIPPNNIGDLNYSTWHSYAMINYKIKGVAPVAGVLPYASFLDKTDQMPILMEENIYDPVVHSADYASAMKYPEIMNQLKTWNAQPGSYPCSYLYGTWDATFDEPVTSTTYHALNLEVGLPCFLKKACDFFAEILENNRDCKQDNLNGASMYNLYSSFEQVSTQLFRTGDVDVETDIETPQLSLYPNPTTDYIIFKGLTKESTAYVTIYDAFGSLMNTYTIYTGIDEQSTSISLAGIATGMYYIYIKDALNEKQFKVMKQ